MIYKKEIIFTVFWHYHNSICLFWWIFETLFINCKIY